MRRHLLVLLLALLAWHGPAQAAPTDADLKRARDRFEYGDYADAARLSARLVQEGRLTTDAQLIEAYRILGLSHFYLGREDAARSAFVSLLSLEPDYRLDPFFHAPKVVEFFDAVKADNEALLAPIREQKRRVAEERRLQEEARQRLLAEESRRQEERARTQGEAEVVERLVARNEYAVNWVPFGAGQFQNGQPLKGSLLAVGQTITGVASVAGFVVLQRLNECRDVVIPPSTLGGTSQAHRVCGIPPESQNLARNMDRVKWTAGGLFWGLVAYGIVDAHLNFEPYRVLSEDQPLPATGAPDGPPEARLDFVPWAGPDGVGASLTLVY